MWSPAPQLGFCAGAAAKWLELLGEAEPVDDADKADLTRCVDSQSECDVGDPGAGTMIPNLCANWRASRGSAYRASFGFGSTLL